MRPRLQIAARVAASAALAVSLGAVTLYPAARAGIVRTGFTEESLPAQDLASPTATPSDTSAQASPAATATPPGAPEGAIAPATGAEAQTEPTPMETPSELPPVDIGSVQPKVRISDSTLTHVTESASSPALAASLRVTEQARKDILGQRTDDAIHALGRALSIDPSNPYAYFYLGRAWLSRKNYGQAMTFFKRAEIGFASNSDWLGETLAFEGLTYEQQNDSQAAMAAYQQALQAEPGNLMARVGYTRLASTMQPAPTASAPESASTTEAAPPPPESSPPPPPDSTPPPSPTD